MKNTLSSKYRASLMSKALEAKKLLSSFESYKEQDFINKTNEFRGRLASGATIDSILPEAVALCAVAIKKKLGYTPFDVQLLSAVALSDNLVCEMKTGEGKTLVQILSSYIHSLEATKDPKHKESVHILTANEYLAERDREQNKSVFELLGLTTSYVQSKAHAAEPGYKQRKKQAYDADIVYATAQTVAFDYMDDNHAKRRENVYINKTMHHAIFDEADDILLDQAVTPLVLSGSMPGLEINNISDSIIWGTEYINGIRHRNKPINALVVPRFEADDSSEETFRIHPEIDCIIYEDEQKVIFNERLYEEIYGSNYSGLTPETQEILFEREQAVTKCLLAKYCFRRNKQYILTQKSDGIYEVSLVDENTGRVKPNSKYRNGIQEAIETKEALLSRGKYRIQRSHRKVEISRFSYPDFAKLYKSGISCMTGTSDVEDFENIYGLETFYVPLRSEFQLETMSLDYNISSPVNRTDLPPSLYSKKSYKYEAIAKEIKQNHSKGIPILVGTTSVKESDELCVYLDKLGIKYQRLDAKNDKNEAQKISLAGQKGMITIATNMAGRGTDIKLGPGVEELGGLYVIGTSRNRNERIDRQLMGRCARVGEPGKTKFFMSLEDEMVEEHLGRARLAAHQTYYRDQKEEITNQRLIRLVESCQGKNESIQKQIRKDSRELEEKTLTIQREAYMSQRNEILFASQRNLMNILIRIIKNYASTAANDETELNRLRHLIDVDKINTSDKQELESRIGAALGEKLRTSKGNIPVTKYVDFLRERMLNVVDIYWISHLENLEMLKKTISASVQALNDPKKEYEIRANELYTQMGTYIQNEMITYACVPSMSMGSYIVQEEPIKGEGKYEVHR